VNVARILKLLERALEEEDGERRRLPPRDWAGWQQRQRLLEERIAAAWAKLGKEPQTLQQRLAEIAARDR
jgi:hypothetical protein